MPGFPLVGHVFDEYQILEVLGRGGMGVVFKAQHLRMARQVALKVIAPHYSADNEFQARFQREAALQASLDSPHIVAVYDHGQIDGFQYIASQLVSGGDLAKHLDAHGPLSRRSATELTLQVASALGDAHRAGVVHRDVKPSNILLRPGGDMFVYLCDFGVAYVVGSHLTQAGNVVGTYGYLAPERCNDAPATPASDQYSLGCLFVAALSGHAPYSGSDVMVAQQHLHGPIPQIDEIESGDRTINLLLTRLLAKDPADRFASMDEVCVELRALLRTIEPAGTSSEDQSATMLRPFASSGPAVPPDATVQKASSGTRAPQTPPPHEPSHLGKTLAIAGTILLAVVVLVGGGFLFASTLTGDDGSSGAAQQKAPAPAPTTASQSAANPATPDESAPAPPLSGMRGAAYENLPCNGKYIVILATATEPEQYDFKLQEAILEAGDDQAKYLHTASSCAAFAPDAESGGSRYPIYNAYVGPFDTLGEACAARARLTRENAPLAWVRQLQQGTPPRMLCTCLPPRATPPTIVASNPQHDDYVQRRYVADAQYILYRSGYNESRSIAGMFTRDNAELFKPWQSDHGLEATGELDPLTWQSLLDEFCTNPRWGQTG